MKALIKSVKFTKESEGKFGPMFSFKITYTVDGVDKMAYYTAKTKEQKKFIEGQEAEFTEEQKMGTNDTPYNVIKPIQQGGYNNSGFGKALKKEQSKYSGFAVSYVKDLIIAGKIEMKDWEQASEKIFNFMVKLDKSIEV